MTRKLTFAPNKSIDQTKYLSSSTSSIEDTKASSSSSSSSSSSLGQSKVSTPFSSTTISSKSSLPIVIIEDTCCIITTKLVENESDGLQQLKNQKDKVDLEIDCPVPTKVINSFEDLCKLKARSRLPIDIQHAGQNLQKRMSRCVDGTTESNFDNTSHYGSMNYSIDSINFTSFGNKSGQELSSDKQDLKIKDAILSLQHAASINSTSPLLSNTNDATQKKYFSFLTTNKLFSSSNRTILNNPSTNSYNEPKLKILNDQLVDLNENVKEASEKSPGEQRCNLEKFLSFSSASSSASDSSCSNSIARSSILTNFNISQHSSESCKENSTRLSPLSPLQTTPKCDSTSTTSLYSTINTNNYDELKSLRTCHDEMIKITKKPVRQSKELKEHSSRETNTKQKNKILTVLFDYESPKKNGCSNSSFKVNKGENVKVIRDYDDEYYLVAKVSNGNVGFIPKDYTEDLNEIKQRLRSKLLQLEQLNKQNLLENFKSSSHNSLNTNNDINNNRMHMKFTQF